MFDRKIFIYTIIVFLLICLVSYGVQAQEKTLSLKQAVSMAIANNRELKVNDLDIDKSKQQIRVARSRFLPVVSAGAQIAHYFELPVFFGLTGGSSGNGNSDKIPYGRFGGKDQAIAALNISQPLYDAEARPALAVAKLQERISGTILSGNEAEVAASVRQSYLQLLVLNERIKLQQESLNRNQKALDDARSLLAQGRALRVDTLRAYTSVKNLEPELLRLSNAISVGKLQLKTLIGIDSLPEILLSDSLRLSADNEIPAEENIYEEASRNRADLKSLALQQQVDDQQIKLASGNMKPQVSVVAQYQVQTQTNQFNYLDAYYPSTPFLGAQVTVPIFNGNSNLAKKSQAKIGRQQTELKLEHAKQQLKTEVRQVYSNLLETTARIKTRITVKETAQLSYDITQYRYAKGVASRLELTDAELALTGAQLNYLEAVYDYLSSRISLDRVTGRVGN